MIPDAAPERLAMPTPPPAAPRSGFPWVATAAPVAVSLGIWGVTGSPYSLIFAALGPVVAVGSVLDSRRQRRVTTRREVERTLVGLERAHRQVLDRHERERARLDRLAPAVADCCTSTRAAANWARSTAGDGAGGRASRSDAEPLAVRLGRADRPPVVVVDPASGDTESDDAVTPALRSAAEMLRRTAVRLPEAPWVVDARDGIGVVGPPAAARSVARSLAVQLAAMASPAITRVTAPSDEPWVRRLPHAVTVTASHEYRFAVDGGPDAARVAWGATRDALPAGVGTVVELPEADHGSAEAADPRFDALGAVRAGELATALAVLAEERGLGPAGGRLPLAVVLAELLEQSLGEPGGPVAVGHGLGAPIGRDAEGIVELDLVRDGPHAVVAGTTGAGKSELLVSWVLAMAARHPPSAVTFLLVDFKGGAAFAPLAGLPHVIGTVSDLDARRSARAIESLRAELLRRERVLAERGVRSIDELEADSADSARGDGPRLARLVVVVDEFAAVVSGQPELHELFADLSARGRSLGLHLILCTQRPSGVVRDAVLANITLRISLRVTDRGDSLAMLGSDAAARLAPEPRGRALISDGASAPREVQLARAERGDAARLGMPGSPPSGAVWCEPLPELLPFATVQRDALAEGGPGIPFGRLDLPAEQSQPIARHDPRRDGHLLVLGAARSGRTTALATLAAGAGDQGVGCLVIPADPAEAWSILIDLLASASTNSGAGPGAEHGAPALPRAPRLLLLDDVDLLLERAEPDTRHELLELLTRVARSSRSDCLVLSAQRLTGALQSLAGLVDARLLLRQPSRDEHVLSGGDGAAFDPRLPPGAGRFTSARRGGATVQLAFGAPPLPPAEPTGLPVAAPAPGRPLAIVCPRPRELARRWGGGVRAVLLGEQPAPEEGELLVSRGAEPIVLLGDPDSWQAEWALLGLARRELRIAVVGCGSAELRAVTRARDAAPPLGGRADECWLVEAGVVRRAALLLGPDSPLVS